MEYNGDGDITPEINTNEEEVIPPQRPLTVESSEGLPPPSEELPIPQDSPQELPLLENSPQELLPEDSPQALLPEDSPQALLPEDSPQALLPEDSPQEVLPEDSPQEVLPEDSPRELPLPEESPHDLPVPEDSPQELPLAVVQSENFLLLQPPEELCALEKPQDDLLILEDLNLIKEGLDVLHPAQGQPTEEPELAPVIKDECTDNPQDGSVLPNETAKESNEAQAVTTAAPKGTCASEGGTLVGFVGELIMDILETIGNKSIITMTRSQN
ncbi:unnamed protein product [Allacma fusca]|uniref:Uncharacterized protein n=1 Tax=Allacma fusca TaxID=39272 RepID=A0A8J2NRN2_9HEXA|nr:unnamed protein product [Allacma fusca]